MKTKGLVPINVILSVEFDLRKAVLLVKAGREELAFYFAMKCMNLLDFECQFFFDFFLNFCFKLRKALNF